MSEYNINAQWTLAERAKLSLDGKRVTRALDVMGKVGVDAFMEDVPFYPANLGLEHQITRTTSRPSSTLRTFYKGVKKTSTVSQVLKEPVCLFEQRNEVDEDHIDRLDNPDEARAQMDAPHIAGLKDDFVYAMFNHARTSGGEYIDGFAARMNRISYPGGATTSLPYVWDNGGSTNLCSLWMVEYGPQAVHGLYPGAGARNNGTLGIDIRNKGKERVADSDDASAFYYAYVTQFKLWFGLAVWDDWKIARLANIDREETSATALNENLIIKMISHGKFNPGATRIYVNPYLWSQIWMKAKTQSNVQWQPRQILGDEVPTILDIPVRKLSETILSADETQVV